MARTPTPTKREGAGQPPERAPFEPKPGTVVAGKYCVERVIGEGGMGIVVSATHLELEQKVAIKFLLPEAMRDEAVVERFLREAKVAAKVNSEHVARASDVGKMEPGGIPFIVMEYLEGSDLGDLIHEKGQLPIEEVCEIGLQACEALAEVHAAGIVHRDLKPSNLFVTRRADGSPCVKLLDFGISKLTIHSNGEGDSVNPALTSTATIMGSPSYMSPEQLKSTKEVDARTDIWALGAVLYEALTGRPAFRGETVPQVCFMIGAEDPTPPSSVRPEVPEELEAALLACLDKKAETRASLVELARVLVTFAPPRAHVSLERVEATLGVNVLERTGASLPRVLVKAGEGARTQSAWNKDQAKKRRRGGGRALLVLLVAAAGVAAAGIFTGQIDANELRERLSGAIGSSPTASLSSPSSVSPVGSVSSTNTVVASTPPPPESAAPSAVASVVPAGSASASLDSPDAAEDEDEDEDDDASAAPSASTVAVAPGLPMHAPHALVPKHSSGKPKHWHKSVHKKHRTVYGY